MTHDAMTHDAVRPANEVRILELEVQKLEFEKRIAQLKAEQSINKDCIGCAGPCKVVDVAANLQKELDECSNMNLSLLEERDEAVEVIRSKDRVIYTLNKTIEGNESDHASDYEIMRTNHRNTVAKLQDDIRGLEAELSARRDDSAVLMEVVEIIKDDTIPNSKVPCMIFNLVKDYLDAPEGPPETPIDDLYKTTVSVFLEMP